MAPVRKKRPYSINGCSTCKKRRARCDETKPKCNNCSKTGRECSYTKSIKFSSARSFVVQSNGTHGVPKLTNVKMKNDTLPALDDSEVHSSYSERRKQSINPFLGNRPTVIENSTSDPPSEFYKAPVSINDNLIASTLNINNQSPSQSELESSLLNGATNLIADLNDIFSNFDSVSYQLGDQFENFKDSAYSAGESDSICFESEKPIIEQQLDTQSEKADLKTLKELKPYFTNSNAQESTATSRRQSISSSSSKLSPKLDTNEKYIDTINMTLTSCYLMDKIAQSPVASAAPYKSSTDVIKSVGLKAFPCPQSAHLYVNNFDYVKILDTTVDKNTKKSLANYFNWPIESTQLSHLSIYYNKIHLNLSPFTTTYINNAYINTFLSQAKNAPHLLFAILGMSARYEHYQVEQRVAKLRQEELINNETNGNGNLMQLEENERIEYHKNYRAFYSCSCLRSLSDILLSKNKTLNNIESLLLTIVVLASDFSGLKGGKWREHLHGAKDLLTNYVKWGTMEKEDVAKESCSIELVIVWLWFYAMEVLAVVSSPNGGTIHNVRELKEFLPVLLTSTDSSPGSVSSAMLEFGFSIRCGTEDDPRIFNMYLGYDECVIEAFNDLVLGLECIRKYKLSENLIPNLDHLDLSSIISTNQDDKSILVDLNASFVLQVLSKIERARNFQYISNKLPYHIPKEHPLHPIQAFADDNNRNILTSAYIKTSNGEYYSWIDLSQQLFADAILLRLLVHRTMSIRSSFIRDVVDRMLAGLRLIVYWKGKYAGRSKALENMLQERYGSVTSMHECLTKWPAFKFDEYLNFSIDNRLVMVQWPLYILGLCCLKPEEKAIVECCFDGLVKLGVGSGELSLKKLQKVWNMERESSFNVEDPLFNVFGRTHTTASNKKDNFSTERKTNSSDDESDCVPFA